MNLEPKRTSESATEMVQVVLPNDANPLGYIRWSDPPKAKAAPKVKKAKSKGAPKSE